MRVHLRVLARLDRGWPVWDVSEGGSGAMATVIASWPELEALVLAHGSVDLDLSFGDDALCELISALGEPPWTIPGIDLRGGGPT